ncbi:MAG: helix-turn-helix transcriptional regulator [uncultured Clostridium sp.]
MEGKKIMDIEIEEKVNLGMQLRVNRLRRGLSVKELAKKSGVSITAIDWAENGRTKNTRLDVIIRWADVLNIPLEELIVERRIIV